MVVKVVVRRVGLTVVGTSVVAAVSHLEVAVSRPKIYASRRQSPPTTTTRKRLI